MITARLPVEPVAAAVGVLAVVGLVLHVAGEAGVRDLLALPRRLRVLLGGVLRSGLIFAHVGPRLVARLVRNASRRRRRPCPEAGSV